MMAKCHYNVFDYDKLPAIEKRSGREAYEGVIFIIYFPGGSN